MALGFWCAERAGNPEWHSQSAAAVADRRSETDIQSGAALPLLASCRWVRMRGDRVGKRRASWQERTELHRCYGLAIGPKTLRVL